LREFCGSGGLRECRETDERVNEDEDEQKRWKRKDGDWNYRHLMISNLSPPLG